MLICDFSQLVIASYMAMATSGSADAFGVVDEDIVRHVSLDGIRFINSKFRGRYGEPILAIDSSKGSWRKEVFPYYKAHRSVNRKKSNIDWPELLRIMSVVKTEIKENFPYKVIEVDRAEADDIIGVLARRAVAEQQDCMIVSGDKDFIQLQINNDFIQQWDKRTDTYVGSSDPKRYLFEHVLKGDSGDGIPNILSPADSFVNKIRQKPMTQKRLDEYWDDPTPLKDSFRFRDNLKIIDLRYTPTELISQINEQFDNYQAKDRSTMKQFFIDKRLRKLYENIQDF